MIKFATVLGIASLAASQALAGSGYGSAGHECGSYSSAQASVPSVDTAEGYSLPATTTTVETVEAPVLVEQGVTTYETVQVVPSNAVAELTVLPLQ